MPEDKKAFNIIAVAQVTNTNKQIALSENDKGEIVLAQRMAFNDNGKMRYYYDKGALTFKDKEAFKKFIEEIHNFLK